MAKRSKKKTKKAVSKKTSRSRSNGGISKKRASRKASSRTGSGSRKKTVRKKAAKKAAKTRRRSSSDSGSRATGVAAAAVPPVRVRMYRQGLGDCFLVTFGEGEAASHMLIDCGTLGSKTTDVSIADVAEHIAEETGGRLDLLIATHEHQDHVSGFRPRSDGSSKFDAIAEVRNVWLAWTEDKEDELAQRLAKTRKDLGIALRAAVDAPAAAGLDKKLRGFVDDLLGFGGVGFAKTVDAAMDYVRTRSPGAPRFLNPGDGPIEPDWAPGFRFYVLGPPRDAERLGDLGEHGSENLYALRAALGARSTGLDEDTARYHPFDLRFEAELGAGITAWYPGYLRQTGRRIDTTWAESVADLALQLDSMTNNTSLVLAIERLADGKVLLFPADAQEGNWLSWHDCSWKVDMPDGSERTVSTTELLGRVVFYKVGHHGSHNATGRGKGLELMGDDLTAFIPVDRAIALNRNPKGSWKMPAFALYRRLLEKCDGRVARADIGWARPPAADEETEAAFAEIATDAEWRGWKRVQRDSDEVKEEDLFIEYMLR